MKMHIIFGACGGLNVFTVVIMFNNCIIHKVNKNFGAYDGLIVLAIILHAYDIRKTHQNVGASNAKQKNKARI